MNVAHYRDRIVGLVTGACLAISGTPSPVSTPRVAHRHAARRRTPPSMSPACGEVVFANVAAGRLRVLDATSAPPSARSSVAVPRRRHPRGRQRRGRSLTAGRRGCHSSGPSRRLPVIATKSTVPVGTGSWLRAQSRRAAARFVIRRRLQSRVSAEGSAVNDFLRPDRVVIGTTSERAACDHARDLPSALSDRNARSS